MASSPPARLRPSPIFVHATPNAPLGLLIPAPPLPSSSALSSTFLRPLCPAGHRPTSTIPPASDRHSDRRPPAVKAAGQHRPRPRGGDVASATSPATSALGLTWHATWTATSISGHVTRSSATSALRLTWHPVSCHLHATSTANATSANRNGSVTEPLRSVRATNVRYGAVN